MIILEKDTRMFRPFAELSIGAIFYWASWCWIKTDATHAASYDNAARMTTGNTMVQEV